MFRLLIFSLALTPSLFCQLVEVPRPMQRTAAPILDRSHFNDSLIKKAITTDDCDALNEVVWTYFCDLETTDACGITLMHYAAFHNAIKIIKHLHALGANIEARGVSGTNTEITPLHSAAMNNQTAAISLLIALGANREAKQHCDRTPLHCAVCDNHPRAIKCLVSLKADLEAKDVQGYTPLLLAIDCKNSEAIKTLLELGANPNTANNDNQTVIRLAIDRNLTDSIMLLWLAGANIKSIVCIPGKEEYKRTGKCISQMNILHNALNSSDLKAALNNPLTQKGFTILMGAILNGFLPLVSLIINKGANINLTDIEGNTALHHAVSTPWYRDSADVVRILLSRRDITLAVANNRGKTAEQCANDCGYQPIILEFQLLRRKIATFHALKNLAKPFPCEICIMIARKLELPSPEPTKTQT